MEFPSADNLYLSGNKSMWTKHTNPTTIPQELYELQGFLTPPGAFKLPWATTRSQGGTHNFLFFPLSQTCHFGYIGSNKNATETNHATPHTTTTTRLSRRNLFCYFDLRSVLMFLDVLVFIFKNANLDLIFNIASTCRFYNSRFLKPELS